MYLLVNEKTKEKWKKGDAKRLLNLYKGNEKLLVLSERIYDDIGKVDHIVICIIYDKPDHSHGFRKTSRYGSEW